MRVPAPPRTLRFCVAAVMLAGCTTDRSADGAWDGLPLEIELEHLAAVSDLHEPGFLDISRPPAVQVDSRGRFYARTHGLAAVAVFGRDGEFLTTLGRRGQGPGEFQWAMPPIVGPGDSVFVFDGRLRRVSVFAPDFSFARSTPVRHWPAIVLPDGGYVVAQRIPSPEQSGQPLHHSAEDGRVLASFGAGSLHSVSDDPSRTERHVAASRRGGIWSAPTHHFVFERWNVETGERLQVVAPGNAVMEEADPQQTELLEMPVIEGVWEDADGFIWRFAVPKWAGAAAGHG